MNSIGARRTIITPTGVALELIDSAGAVERNAVRVDTSDPVLLHQARFILCCWAMDQGVPALQVWAAPVVQAEVGTDYGRRAA